MLKNHTFSQPWTDGSIVIYVRKTSSIGYHSNIWSWCTPKINQCFKIFNSVGQPPKKSFSHWLFKRNLPFWSCCLLSLLSLSQRETTHDFTPTAPKVYFYLKLNMKLQMNLLYILKRITKYLKQSNLSIESFLADNKVIVEHDFIKHKIDNQTLGMRKHENFQLVMGPQLV